MTLLFYCLNSHGEKLFRVVKVMVGKQLYTFVMFTGINDLDVYNLLQVFKLDQGLLSLCMCVLGRNADMVI